MGDQSHTVSLSMMDNRPQLLIMTLVGLVAKLNTCQHRENARITLSDQPGLKIQSSSCMHVLYRTREYRRFVHYQNPSTAHAHSPRMNCVAVAVVALSYNTLVLAAQPQWTS